MKINNWGDDENDLILRSGVYFEKKKNEQSFFAEIDYSKEIMQFLNYLIALPYRQHHKAPMTNYQFFTKVMKRIFGIVYTKDTGNDIAQLLTEDGDVSVGIRARSSLSSAELEHQEKV